MLPLVRRMAFGVFDRANEYSEIRSVTAAEVSRASGNQAGPPELRMTAGSSDGAAGTARTTGLRRRGAVGLQLRPDPTAMF